MTNRLTVIVDVDDVEAVQNKRNVEVDVMG